MSGQPELTAAQLTDAGVSRGDALALVVSPSGEVAVSVGLASWWAPASEAMAAVAEVERLLRPRWVWWAADPGAVLLVSSGVRPAMCWDLAQVHRLLTGGGDDGPAQVWAHLHGLAPDQAPRTGQLDLLSVVASPVPDGRSEGARDSDDPSAPVQAGGYLRAEWVDGGWCRTPQRLQRWAGVVWAGYERQVALVRAQPARGDAVRTAYAESAAALLCVELQRDGLPVSVPVLQGLVERAVGERPRDLAHEQRLRQARDEELLRLLPAGAGRVDLRNPLQVRQALTAVGITVPDTRSWRLEAWRGHHPFVDALVRWRKADRIGSTYGYAWLDRHVAADGRLRGPWQASDGAAGRMTAGAGLHNLPAELRPGVAAEPGFVLVRADLGQIEPRVLAAVSGDQALAAATQADDLYAPVAQRLRVERAVAKIAVLAAMYGQTSGTAGEALKGLRSAYPVAMRCLDAASESGRAGRSVVTYGGRQVRMWQPAGVLDAAAAEALRAARGRYARNAVVQGSAAELFKEWAVTVRAQVRPFGAAVVLCLHDELLVQAPIEHAPAVAQELHGSLDRVGRQWARGAAVRFVADVRVVQRWSEVKG